ncbi:unnamed protein product [Microthlaspi erraticum]|uniref:Uncharacterized protein n=1 Tax=Microthlaspi erraticum TaxID=1685480 RepID=A0A6D2HW69_9BRAS|nr:unnamed protein product [Microthlaspi erraticum]
MSSSEYPIAFLYFLSSQRSKASSTLFSSAFTITGYVELGPRNAYLSPAGSVFSSSLGATPRAVDGTLLRWSRSIWHLLRSILLVLQAHEIILSFSFSQSYLQRVVKKHLLTHFVHQV